MSALLRAAAAAALGARRRASSVSAFPDLGAKMRVRILASGLDASEPIASWLNEGTAGDDWSQATSGARPTHGTVNGIDAAAFDGVDDLLSGALLLPSVITAAEYHVFAVLQILDPVSPPASAVPTYLGAQIVGEGAGWWGLSMRKDGDDFFVDGFHWPAAAKYATKAAPNGVPFLVEWRYDGANIFIRVDADPEVTGDAAGSVAGGSLPTNNVNLGKGPGSPFLEGSIAEIVICNAACSSGERAAARAYFSATYGMGV